MAGGMGNRPAGAGPQPKRKVTAFERHKAEREEKRLRKVPGGRPAAGRLAGGGPPVPWSAR